MLGSELPSCVIQPGLASSLGISLSSVCFSALRKRETPQFLSCRDCSEGRVQKGVDGIQAGDRSGPQFEGNLPQLAPGLRPQCPHLENGNTSQSRWRNKQTPVGSTWSAHLNAGAPGKSLASGRHYCLVLLHMGCGIAGSQGRVPGGPRPTFATWGTLKNKPKFP